MLEWIQPQSALPLGLFLNLANIFCEGTFFMAEYKPISCSLHDELESAATLRKLCDVVYRVAGGETVTTGRIVDLYAREGAEYLLLDNGQEIRLDYLVRLNGQNFGA